MLDIYIVIEYNMNVMNKCNKIKLFYVIFSLILLVLGVAIYVFFREGTYIHRLLPQVVNELTEPVRIVAEGNVFADFLKYYFADFLWCLSLNFLLLCVTDIKKQSKVLTVCAVSALWGIFYEVAQRFEIVSGTFDFVDIIMYIFASVSAVTINKNFLKRMI